MISGRFVWRPAYLNLLVHRSRRNISDVEYIECSDSDADSVHSQFNLTPTQVPYEQARLSTDNNIKNKNDISIRYNSPYKTIKVIRWYIPNWYVHNLISLISYQTVAISRFALGSRNNRCHDNLKKMHFQYYNITHAEPGILAIHLVNAMLVFAGVSFMNRRMKLLIRSQMSTVQPLTFENA